MSKKRSKVLEAQVNYSKTEEKLGDFLRIEAARKMSTLQRQQASIQDGKESK